MLNKLKNFSKSKLGAVVVFIVALPFVFFGMGSVFQNKDTNNVAKIDNYNVTTKNFTNHISSLGISCLLYTSPSPRDNRTSRMPSSA